MCFSAEASFTVGAALIPTGIYCLWSAAVKKPSYLGLAAVPLFFGIQQIGEGFVWQALDRHDEAGARQASLFFLFFALAFWPFWLPVLTAWMEPQPKRKLAFAVFSLIATGWFFVLFFPLLVGPESLLTTTTDEHHRIVYRYDGLTVYQYVERNLLRVLYFLCVALPPLFGSDTWGRIPGLIIAASALLAAGVYHYAFVSVWCFFAAVLAIYLGFVFYRLPMPRAKACEAVPAQVAPS